MTPGRHGRTGLGLCLLALWTLLAAGPELGATPAAPFGFITRVGDRLMEGEREFRFISFNHPNLHISENPVWRRMTAWEQEDGVRSIAQMGGRVVRIYTFSVRGGRRNGPGLSHIRGPGDYDEELFRDLDRLLAICRRHEVRVIIPFIDEWDWFGGIGEFAALHGRAKAEFYTDAVVQADFRRFVTFLLTRVNTVTGVPYRDDPTILAWESGNELAHDPEAWVSDLAALVKELAPNHLFQDGHCAIRPGPLADPRIDLLTAHYYGTHDYATAARRHRDATRGLKPFYVGEFDPRARGGLLDEVVANGSAGALFWGLRGHRTEGGYFCHFDPLYYHWPYDEETRVARTYAYRIQGRPEPPRDVPLPPEMIPASSPEALAWRGSTGAKGYRLERAEAPAGPWVTLAEGISDKVCAPPLYRDETAVPGRSYLYRVSASNEAGTSAPSAPVAVPADWKPES